MSENRLHFPDAPIIEPVEGYRAFGVSETFSDVVMLDVRFKNGNRIGLPYPWLGKATFTPPVITLVFSTGAEVTVRGRNLEELFVAVLRHQCVFICEANRPTADLVPESMPMVEEIDVKASS